MADGRGYARNGRGRPGSDLQDLRLEGPGADSHALREKDEGGQGLKDPGINGCCKTRETTGYLS
jgi:hypothetical protein